MKTFVRVVFRVELYILTVKWKYLTVFQVAAVDAEAYLAKSHFC